MDGLHRFRNPDTENMALMQSLTQNGIVDPKVTRERMNGPLGSVLHTSDRLLDFVDERQHITLITWIALGRQIGNDITGGRLRDDAGLAAELSWTIALAFDDRRHGGIVSIDDFEGCELLALGELFGLLADLLMMAHRGAQVLAELLTLSLTERYGLFQRRLSLLSQHGDVFALIKELLFGLANQLDKDFTLATTATTKAAHNLAETLLQVLRLSLHSCAATVT